MTWLLYVVLGADFAAVLNHDMLSACIGLGLLFGLLVARQDV